MKYLDPIRRAWHRRYLTIDRYMAGKFIKLFTVTTAIVLTFFLFFYILSNHMKGWTPGEVFLQMTNPSPSGGIMREVDWLLIIAINLFGMFVVNGVLLTLMLNWLTNRRERYISGMARYEVVKGSRFSVIIGGHSMVARLARRLLERGDLDYVIVQTARDPVELRREIYAEIKDRKRAADIIIYSGDRTSWHELEQLNAVRANEIFIIGENEEIDKFSHDEYNLKCWQLLREYITEPKDRKLPCHVMLDSETTFFALQKTDIDLDDTRTFRFIPFSLHETWARKVLCGSDDSWDSLSGIDYIPLDGRDGMSYDNQGRVHLIISGFNKLGKALFSEAAHLAHYPNFLNVSLKCPRTLITVVDENMQEGVRLLMGKTPALFNLVRWRYIKAPGDLIDGHKKGWRFYEPFPSTSEVGETPFPWNDPTHDPSLHSPYYGGFLGEDFIDMDFEFIEGDLTQPSVRQYLVDSCNPDNERGCYDKVTLAICEDNPTTALSKALTLPESVYEQSLTVLVEQNASASIIEGVRKGATGKGVSKFHKLRPFGMVVETDYMGFMESRLPHYVAYAYEALNRDSSFAEEYRKLGVERLKKEVEENWLNMRQDGGKSCIAKRWSNLYSALGFNIKMRSIDNGMWDNEIISDPRTIDLLARTEHNRWVMEQLLLGMCPPSRDYASRLPIEDRETRTYLKSRGIHPDLISNDKLGYTSLYDAEIVKIIPLVMTLAQAEG